MKPTLHRTSSELGSNSNPGKEHRQLDDVVCVFQYLLVHNPLLKMVVQGRVRQRTTKRP
jgi:hypothetical protein